MGRIESIDCVVPAAGRSERMGQWKPMLPFDETTIIETVVARALAACRRVILVTGYRGEELEALFRGAPRVLAVRNPEWELGMFSSIKGGAACVDTGRFFVTLGDMPGIDTEIYAALSAGPEGEVAFPAFGGVRGHPVLVSAAARQAVLEADSARGSMREILSRFPARDVRWRDDSILRDIDTAADYQRIVRRGEASP